MIYRMRRYTGVGNRWHLMLPGPDRYGWSEMAYCGMSMCGNPGKNGTDYVEASGPIWPPNDSGHPTCKTCVRIYARRYGPCRILFACGALLNSSAPLKNPRAPIVVWCNQPVNAHADLPPEEQGRPVDHPLRPDDEKARCLFGCETDTDESGRKHHRCLADDGTPYFVVTCRPVEVLNATA